MLQGDHNTTLGTDQGCRVLGPFQVGGGIALVLNWDTLRHSAFSAPLLCPSCT